MIHVTLPQLCAYLDGELAEASAELVRRHLSECLECTERFARLEAQDEILIRILADDPEEEFFRYLSASIPLGQPTSAERPAPAAREKPVPSHAGHRTEDQRRNRPSPRAAWIAVAICCIVAGSAAWVAFRPKEAEPVAKPTAAEPQNAAPETTPRVEMEPPPEQPPDPLAEQQHDPTEAPTQEMASASEPETAPEATSAPTPDVAAVSATPDEATKQPKPERLVERATQNVVPVRTVITETIVESEAQHAAPVPAAPPAPRPSTAPDPVALALRDAKSASLEAARSKLPASFDKSAEAWERALPLLENAPEALAGGRRELAQSRFQAWAAEPTPARREAAIASARRYLLYAPPGPDRDQAWTWLGRLKH
ncbi:MAG: zf-HC2 domain-containing protein [Candidatus Eisenbacteria bacterium]